MNGNIQLEAKNLSVGYSGKPVVEAVNLQMKAGEITALIGPNGAGKSTLLKSIAGQLAPIAGTVLLCGKDLKQTAPQEAAEKMSLLLTGRPQAELMSCREVAAAGRYPYTGRLGILSREDWEKVDRALSRMGAEELSDLPFGSISDGQRQRVLLARALAQEPEVLILDEPASYLDIRYQLELVRALRSLADESALAVIVSFHELDLVRRCADQIVCLKNGQVQCVGDVRSVFSGSYLEELFDLPSGSLQASVPPKSSFEHYVRAGSRKLRCGYTTGTCAALAASCATRRLLFGTWPETVSLITPAGLKVEVSPEACEAQEGMARCGVRKDAGDDADCTADLLIVSEVRLSPEEGIRIFGGEGVGRVTRPGLDQPVGEPAINSVPRRMITEAVSDLTRTADYRGGLEITVSVPEGLKAAEKSFNPQLGIEGGISILGTSGIVEPMSQRALIDSIALELRQQRAEGAERLFLTPGNYGRDYIRSQGWDQLGVPIVRCSNFIGEALDECRLLKYRKLLLVGHIGKLVKLAGGIMDTHSRQADCRRELFCAHAVLCGAPAPVCRELMECVSTDACVDLLQREALLQPVMESLMSAIEACLQKRVGSEIQIAAFTFSNVHGELGKTSLTEELLQRWLADGGRKGA